MWPYITQGRSPREAVIDWALKVRAGGRGSNWPSKPRSNKIAPEPNARGQAFWFPAQLSLGHSDHTWPYIWTWESVPESLLTQPFSMPPMPPLDGCFSRETSGLRFTNNGSKSRESRSVVPRVVKRITQQPGEKETDDLGLAYFNLVL